MTLVCGIDIGLDGGVAVLDVNTMQTCVAEKMPRMINARGKHVIDVRSLRRLVPKSCVLVVMEYTHSFGTESRSSCFSFGRSTGKIQALFELEDIPTEEVTPQGWKAEILAGTKKDKLAAIGWAQARWPKLKQPMPDGIADALCMAEYARRLIIGKTNTGVTK